MDGSAQLTEVRFSRKRQGYDPDEVDNFLERIGERVYELQENVRAANKRVEAAEGKVAAAEGKVAAAEGKAAAETAETQSQPGRPGRSTVKSAEAEDLEETLKNTLILAQRTADTAVKEATAESERIVSEARATATRLERETDAACQAKLQKAGAEAQKRVDAASGPIKTEVLRLEERQKRLTDETAALESHLEAQRARIRDALATLQAVIDDPARFASARRPDASTPSSAAAATRAAKPTSSNSTAPGRFDAEAAPATRSAPKTSRRVEPVAPSADPMPVPATATAKPKPLESRPTAGSAADAAASARPQVLPPRPTARPGDDGGPPTAQIDLTADAPVVEDDNFLDQLRRAVGEDDPEPAEKDVADEAMQAFFEQHDGEIDAQPRRSRFGRRH